MSALARALLAEIAGDPDACAQLRALLSPTRDERPAAPVVYTPVTLARELGITPRAIRAAIGRGDLVADQSGGRWVISADSVKAWATPNTPARRAARTGRRTGVMREALR